MAGGATGPSLLTYVASSPTHLPLPELERPGEQLGLRLGQLVTPRGRESRAGPGVRARTVIQVGRAQAGDQNPSCLSLAGWPHLLFRPVFPPLGREELS